MLFYRYRTVKTNEGLMPPISSLGTITSVVSGVVVSLSGLDIGWLKKDPYLFVWWTWYFYLITTFVSVRSFFLIHVSYNLNKVITSIARSKIFLFNNSAEWSNWGSANDMQSNDINLIDVLRLRIVF